MKQILIIYRYYVPAEKAGGIVSSLKNLVNLVGPYAKLKVLTSNKDLDGSLLPVSSDQWFTIDDVDYYYASEISLALFRAIDLPDIVYINGFYTLDYFLFPLKYFSKKTKVIVAPRGMFQKGALSVKPLKKKLYLSFFKTMGWHKSIVWHATDGQEVLDIKNLFFEASIKLALDTPSAPRKYKEVAKEKKSLKLVFISLITEKKNLLFLLDLVESLNIDICLDVYGPIKDHGYGEKCLAKIERLQNVNYKKAIAPDMIAEILSNYHLFVLPTLGENFGHAIYEALAEGRPVIISNKTPWLNLEKSRSGFDIPISKEKNWKEAIKKFYEMEQDEYNQWCTGAQNKALAYWADNDFESQYRALFSI